MSDDQYSYEDAWKDVKRWAEIGVKFMEQRVNETIGNEQHRLRAKLDGIRTCLNYINETERMHFNQSADDEEEDNE